MNKFTKRLIALASAAILTVGAIPAAHAVYRDDMPYDGVANWALMEVTAMDQLGLVPDELAYSNMSDQITRAEMCAIAVATYEEVTGEEAPMPKEDPFTDTYDENVSKAYALGIVEGDGFGTFRPNDSLKRLEFFCFVSRYLTATGMTVNSSSHADLSRFSDAHLLSKWATEPAKVTVGLNIVEGSGSTLDPLRTTTIMEALAMFYRARNISMDYDPAARYQDLPTADRRRFLRMEQLGMVPATFKTRSVTTYLNRYELSQMVMGGYYLMNGLSAEVMGTPTPLFKDTNKVDPVFAYNLGMMGNRGNGIFDPGGAVPRHEFYVTLASFLEVVGYTGGDEILRDLSVYSDYKSIPESSRQATQIMLAIGAVTPSGNKLEPKKYVTCLEAVLTLKKVVDFYADWCVDGVEPEPYLGQRIVDLAMQYEGYDYVTGGKKPSTGFDCSGFIYYLYKQYGYDLKPGARTQYNALDRSVKKSELIPGDIVFFSKTGKASGIFHVGLYIGDGKIIHASNKKDGVKVSDLSNSWYVKYYFASKRAID